jgi:hypothetical protein
VDRVFADVVLAPNADDACAVLRSECPDLILLSAVCPPRAEEQVVTLLKWLDPYHTAVAFSEERELLTMLGAIPAEVISQQQSVPDLLVQVTTELYEKGNYDGARSAFDGFLRQVSPGCKVRLVESLSEPSDGCDSIYFNVPAPTRAILEATFDEGHEPSIEEFKVLRASAAIASVLLQYESSMVLARPA